MSGIFGIFHTDGKPLDKAHLDQMGTGLSFIRSDGMDVWYDGSVGLGRLKPYDSSTSPDNKLPLKNHVNGIIVVADSRLTNRPELFKTFNINSCPQSDYSDDRLIRQAYEKWGRRCPRYLSGEFAFAIWDSAKRRLVCARDHMGIKPFFYCRLKNTFAFSSQVKGIRVLDFVPIELNENSLASSLFLTDADKSQTYFKGIRRLKAAHILEIHDKHDGALAATSFWTPRPKNRSTAMSDDDYAEAFREIIVNAVCKRLAKEHPTGVMLSGGLDSSAIATIAARQLRKTGRSLFTVSSALPENHDGIERDERYYIGEAAAKESNIVINYVTAAGADPFQNLQSKFDRFGIPVNTFHYMDEALANAFSALGVKTVLSGFHGDTFASYDGRDSLSCLFRYWRWDTALRCMRQLKKVQHETLLAQSRNTIFPWLFPKGHETLRRLKHGWQREKSFSPVSKTFLARFRRGGSRVRIPFLTRLPLLIAYGSPAIEYQDADYASLGMDIRFPYWDKEIVEFLIDIPPEQFIAGGLKRSLFRRAMKGILPETVRLRNTKHPYTPDFHRRVMAKEKEIKMFLDTIESDSALKEMISFYIDTAKIRKKLESIKPARGRADWDSDTQNIVVSGILLIRFLIWMNRL